MCNSCGKSKCGCSIRVISKTGKTGKGAKGATGKKGDTGPQGPPGQSYTPTVYYVKDNGTQPILNNASLNIDDPDLVIVGVPSGTYLVFFDADTLFSREDLTPEFCYFNYKLNDGTTDLIARGSVKQTEETTQNFKATFQDRIVLTSTKTLTIKYRISSDIPLTPFVDTTSQLQIFARALTLLKVA